MSPLWDQNFWNSIWSSLISNLLFTFAIAFFISKLIDNFRKPKLEISLDIGSRLDGQKVFHLIVKNVGRQGFMQNEVQWRFYFDWSFMPVTRGFSAFIHENKSYFEFSGFNDSPILPSSYVVLDNIVVELANDFPHENLSDAVFYCAISTKSGVWKPIKTFFSSELDKVVFHHHVKVNAFRINKITF